MNEENQVETMEEGSALSDELLNAINEDWDTDVLPGDDTADEEEQEETADSGENADQQETEEPQDKAAETEVEPEKAKAETDQFELKHLDETRTVSRDEVITLAQKGMDYDRIRWKYDESKPVMELFGSFAKQAGMSIADYLCEIRTQAKQASGMSEAEAKRAVDLEDREAAVSAREAEEAQRQSSANQAAQAKAAADARRSADIAEFQKLFPDAAKDPKAIPQEVWANVQSGMTLVSAYSKYAVEQANAARQAAEQKASAASQNQANASRATGSMVSAGENTGSKDPFLAGWDS